MILRLTEIEIVISFQQAMKMVDRCYELCLS